MNGFAALFARGRSFSWPRRPSRRPEVMLGIEVVHRKEMHRRRPQYRDEAALHEGGKMCLPASRSRGDYRQDALLSSASVF